MAEIFVSNQAGVIPTVSQLALSKLGLGWNRRDGLLYGLQYAGGTKTVILLAQGVTPGPGGQLWVRVDGDLVPVTETDNVRTGGSITSNIATLGSGSIQGQTLALTGPCPNIQAMLDGYPLDGVSLFFRALFNHLVNPSMSEEIFAAGNWSSTNNGVVWKLNTTKQGETTPSNRITIAADGSITFNGGFTIDPDGNPV